MGRRASLSGIPWPGPRPYEEEEWELFYGRKREVLDVLEKIGGEPLTVLAGRSGSGKTSLMRAGVLPALRLRRYELDSPRVGPAVLLRDWGGAGRHGSVEEVIRAGLSQALKAFGRWTERSELAREDFRAMNAALEASGSDKEIVAVFTDITKAVDDGLTRGVVCILDQFEEILRLGEKVARDAVVIVRELLRSGIGVRLVLSLREEYLADLRGLERSVGGVFGQTYFLSPLRWDAAQGVVNGVAEAAGIEIERGVLDSVFQWLGYDMKENDISDHEPLTGVSQGSGEAVDLLRMQAILFELANDYLESEGNGKGKRNLTSESVRRYRDAFGPDEKGIVASTLTRWVQRAFEEGMQMDLEVEHRTPRAIFQRLIERLAVRVAPHLSSAGYKVSQEESDLFRKAVGEDVWALGLMDSRLRLEMKIVAEGEGEPPQLDQETIRALEGDAEASRRFLSGVALENRWTRVEAAQELLSAFLGSLHELKAGNILKLGYSWKAGNKVVLRWELVHDGLGEPLINWARGRRDSWEDCIASIVVCRGVSPVGILPEQFEGRGRDGYQKGKEVVGFIRWEGCQVAAVPIGEKVVVRDIVFKGCVFKGTIFEGIAFRGCQFIECDLSGVVFRNCELGSPRKPSDEVVFLKCNPASLAILDSRMSRIRFEHCTMSQLTLKGGKVEESVTFVGGKIILSYFACIQNAENITLQNVEVIYSGGDAATWGTISFNASRVSGGPIA